MGQTPTTTSEITAEWLTAALRASGTIGAEVTVTEVGFEQGSAGVGFMGEIGTLAVTYDGAPDAPSTIVAKFPTTDPEISAMMRPTGFSSASTGSTPSSPTRRRSARPRPTTSFVRRAPTPKSPRPTCS